MFDRLIDDHHVVLFVFAILATFLVVVAAAAIHGLISPDGIRRRRGHPPVSLGRIGGHLHQSRRGGRKGLRLIFEQKILNCFQETMRDPRFDKWRGNIRNLPRLLKFRTLTSWRRSLSKKRCRNRNLQDHCCSFRLAARDGQLSSAQPWARPVAPRRS